MDETRKVFGIDLGTTYSCVAQFDNSGRDIPIVLQDEDGSSTTASVVFFDDKNNQEIVGESAKGFSKIYPDKVVSFIKREMSNDKAFKQPTDFPKGWTPSQISAKILEKIVRDANTQGDHNPPINRVVITCPAYFDSLKIERTKDAGKIAGLDVLAIINEPTAAAIAYGQSTGISGKETVLVYDLGGGTFDVTLITIDGSSISDDGTHINTVATDGHERLGGYNWDERLAEHLLGEYNKATKKTLEMKEGTGLFNEMMLIAEKLKRDLSKRDMEVVITLTGEEQSPTIGVSRAKFEELTKDLLEKTIEKMYKVLKDGENEGVNKIDTVLLVGGSTRMPQVKQRIKNELGIEPKQKDVEHCVAKGAAIHALNLSVKKGKEDFIFGKIDKKPDEIAAGARIISTHVTSKNYGIGILSDGKDMVSNMILANTRLDEHCRREKEFRVSEGAAKYHSMSFPIYESECRDELYNPEQGNCLKIENMPLPSNVEEGRTTKVVFQVDAEGILHVHGEVAGVIDTIDFNLKVNGVMSEEELNAAKAEATQTKAV